MKAKLKRLKKLIYDSPLCPVFKVLYGGFNVCLYAFLCVKWRLQGHRLPSSDERERVGRDVTFIFKSFERQSMAKRLYRCIRRYYPDAHVVIADDSKKPLKLKGERLEVVQLEFNRGLSYGLNRALERVGTKYTMRLDDDMLLTPLTRIHEQLDFLEKRKNIDICAVQACSAPKPLPPKQAAADYLKFDMKESGRELLIPHRTQIDESHFVFGKTPNCFLIRTDKYKALGYDDNIRMIDHHEFFMRAAGVLVAVADVSSFVFHYHNRFDRKYDVYRSDFLTDRLYIQKKHGLR
ncbi:MAG: glycosyltransferase [Clostridia bacterium]|nr:glycosyltransferase [Clostridia bacterium]